MTLMTIDTQQIYRNLADKGGFSETQAATLTEALKEIALLNVENLATKDDLKRLEARMATKNELKLMEQRLTIRLGGIMVVGLGVLAALQQMLG